MDVPAALVAVLLPTRQPQPQPGVLAARQPHAIVLTREHVEPEHVDVEALEHVHVADLERQLGDAVREHRA